VNARAHRRARARSDTALTLVGSPDGLSPASYSRLRSPCCPSSRACRSRAPTRSCSCVRAWAPCRSPPLTPQRCCTKRAPLDPVTSPSCLGSTSASATRIARPTGAPSCFAAATTPAGTPAGTPCASIALVSSSPSCAPLQPRSCSASPPRASPCGSPPCARSSPTASTLAPPTHPRSCSVTCSVPAHSCPISPRYLLLHGAPLCASRRCARR
jgi:hypothetical protein